MWPPPSPSKPQIAFEAETVVASGFAPGTLGATWLPSYLQWLGGTA